MTPRVIVIGAGPNGLVAAYRLARAGLAPLVLERREQVGGSAVTREIVPGVRVPALAHAAGPIRRDVAAEMRLAERGLRWIAPPVASFTPSADGRALVLERDPRAAAASIARFSARDAERYPELLSAAAAIGAIADDMASAPPPSLDSPTTQEIWRLLKTGRRARALKRQGLYRALRWGPMPVADLLEDWFETGVLRATLATRGVFATALGPRSAGTAALLLLEAGRVPKAPFAPTFVQGGPGALAAAMADAAREAGAEIRVNARVAAIEAVDEKVRAVVLDTGERIEASAVVSNADPKHTLLDLIDPVQLEPAFLHRLRNYRTRGTVAKLNVVLNGLPSFTAAGSSNGPAERLLGGRILIAPDVDTLERAFDASKYGEWSPRPWLECTIPTLSDPGLAAGGRHVLSIYAQYAPYRLRSGTWADAGEALTRAVIDTLAEQAPDLPARIEAVELLSPVDLERGYGFTGGHIQHGEMALDQLYVMRPVLGWAQYRTPIRSLYLCGAGTHPGGGITGANGANAASVVVADLRREPAGSTA
jgi:phytoene dehydrogenase-like protein